MTKSHLALIEFTLAHVQREPVRKRIEIYRALANLCGDVDETRSLESIANDLEAAERRATEFAFDFRRKNS